MNTQTITLKVPDMHCASCPRLISMDLEDKSGVVSVNANLDTKSVVIEYDIDTITPDELISVIKNSGYTATL